MQVVKKYSETELVMLLRQRSGDVFEYLYDNYAGALHSIILNIVKEEEQASDVLQEVFVKIWKQIGNYDSSKGRLFTWMLNIARNSAIDLVRSRHFQNSQQTLELSEEVYNGGSTDGPNTDHIGLRKIVHQLKEEQRVLIELAYFQGYTQDEIAKLTALPLGTVKTRIRAGLTQLRQMIKI